MFTCEKPQRNVPASDWLGAVLQVCEEHTVVLSYSTEDWIKNHTAKYKNDYKPGIDTKLNTENMKEEVIPKP